MFCGNKNGYKIELNWLSPLFRQNYFKQMWQNTLFEQYLVNKKDQLFGKFMLIGGLAPALYHRNAS